MRDATQLLLPLDLPPVLSSERFYTSPSNQEAFAWIQRWPNWPQRCLAVYGPPGCGKTHLGHVWQHHTQGYWVEETVCNAWTPTDLVLKHPALVIDNAHLFRDETYLFHLYNAIQENRGWLLLLAPQPPARWKIGLPDLHSRLKMLPVAQIFPPDDDLLHQVLQKLFADLQVEVEDEVLTFLIQHMERSFLSAQRLVDFLNQESLRLHRGLTRHFVREQWRKWLLNAQDLL
ncbi:MAG: HdaA/DnaA family protein [Alphaproteobacteria bacterium]